MTTPTVSEAIRYAVGRGLYYGVVTVVAAAVVAVPVAAVAAAYWLL